MGTKKSSKIAKTVFLIENSTRKWKRAGLIDKKCLGGYFDLSSKTYRDFFLKNNVKNLQVLTL